MRFAPSIVLRVADTPAATELSVSIWNAVVPERAVGVEETRAYQRGCDAYVDVIAYLDGEPAGCAFAAIEPHRRRHDAVFALNAVLRERRRRGVGTALYGALSRWARAYGRTALEVPVFDDDPDGRAFAAGRGFAEIGRETRLALCLAAIDEPPVEPPAGIEIVPWSDRPDLARGMYAVYREAGPDVPGEEDADVEPFEFWLEHHMGGPGDRAEATFVAVAGDEVVGYAKLSLGDARPGVAAHDLTGVKRSWRGRGIARALKAAEIAWARREGYERLETANEIRNAPIRRLNERFGYREAGGRSLMRGPLAP